MTIVRALLIAALVGVCAAALAAPQAMGVVPEVAAKSGCAVVVKGAVKVPTREIQLGLPISYRFPEKSYTVADTTLVPLRPVIEWLGGTLTVENGGASVAAHLPFGEGKDHALIFDVGALSATLWGALSAGSEGTDAPLVPDADAGDPPPGDAGVTELHLTVTSMMALPILQSNGVTYVTARGLLQAVNLVVSPAVTLTWDGDHRTVTFHQESISTDLTLRDWTTALFASIETEKGSMLIHLCQDDAPATVNNFVSLAQKGFYDGLTFHRVETGAGFQLIQGGDPTGNGSGGPGYTIKREISPRLTHKEGAVAMARSLDPDSAGSQFYICNCAIPQLDGGYAVFGYVVDGLDVSRKIVKGDTMQKVTIVTLWPITVVAPDGTKAEGYCTLPMQKVVSAIDVRAVGGSVTTPMSGSEE
jgi:peptidyl-prolyl cis-trans isomerase B (cyclophilin B)